MDDFEIGPLLGRGGMGEVHIARHRGRVVVVKRVRKTLSVDRSFGERLADEGRLLGRVDHPNVVSALGGGTDKQGQPYLVMSRAFGTPLDTVITGARYMSRDRITAIISQLCAGLIAIHDARVIHGDLKSNNIMVDELDRITIIDFGLARTVTRDLDQQALFAGTPAYMAPEVMAGDRPSIAADIFAAGVILYELLTGSTPHPRNLAPTLMLSLLLDEPLELPSKRAPARAITRQLDDVLVCALATQPEARFPTARAFANAVAEALAAWEPAVERPPAKPDPTAAPTLIRRDPTAMIISEALGAVAARIAKRDVPGAVEVLENALQRLTQLAPDRVIAPTAWRLETVLAALYDSVGKKDHARRFAQVAFQHALRTECPIAKARTGALVTQMIAGRTRVARGSAELPARRPARRAR